jgi:hypothetical protein
MAVIKGIQHGLQSSWHSKGMFRKPGFHRLHSTFLIAFHREYIVGLLFENRLGDGLSFSLRRRW